MSDTIKRGDRVSWQSSTGYEPRRFGRVIRVCTKDYQPAYSVTGDDGIGRIVPARFVTKEVG
jgi:hypothetical protein